MYLFWVFSIDQGRGETKWGKEGKKEREEERGRRGYITRPKGLHFSNQFPTISFLESLSVIGHLTQKSPLWLWYLMDSTEKFKLRMCMCAYTHTQLTIQNKVTIIKTQSSHSLGSYWSKSLLDGLLFGRTAAGSFCLQCVIGIMRWTTLLSLTV